jgi:hypothetical protein
MAAIHKNSGRRLHNSSRRIVVVAVPPVDELDLVGPLQVLNSVNRLAGRNISGIEVVTNADRLTVEGEHQTWKLRPVTGELLWGNRFYG